MKFSTNVVIVSLECLYFKRGIAFDIINKVKRYKVKDIKTFIF